MGEVGKRRRKKKKKRSEGCSGGWNLECRRFLLYTVFLGEV